MKRLIVLSAFLAVLSGHSSPQKTVSHIKQSAPLQKDSAKAVSSRHLIRQLNTTVEYQKALLYVSETQIAEKQNFETPLEKSADDDKELLKNYKILMTLDSINGNYQKAYKWQREYFSLKEQMMHRDAKKMGTSTNVIEEETDTDADITTDVTPDDKASAVHIETYTPQTDQLKLISYGLFTACITALTFVLLIYLKRRKTLKHTKVLEIENEQIQLQNASFIKQNERLEDINKMKDRIFSIVSHDLKDSISSIKEFLDLLKEDNITKEEFEALIPDLSENANNASLLLFNLLNWSKSQMQNLEPHPESFNIQEIFHDKMSLVEHQREKKNLVFIDESQPEFVYADKSMVKIIMQNLIMNAVKFSHNGDVITISNQEYHDHSLTCIEDTGVGISNENLLNLFHNNNFTTTGTKNEIGTGLGLAICKELVELNHGRIWAESSSNVGTKFYIELPKTKID